MELITAFVQSPVKVSVGVLLVVLFGMVALLRMPMQLTPEVQTPTISVQTRWPGASPQEIEREIVVEQEAQLKSVEGLTKMTSQSMDSSSTISLEFLVGTDMQKAIVDVIGRLEQVREYPEDADKPTISTSDSSDRPIAWFILSALPPSNEDVRSYAEAHPEMAARLQPVLDAHNPGLAVMRLRELAKTDAQIRQTFLPPDSFDVTELRRFAEDNIEARFERVSGVSQANVIGGLEEELQVVVDPAQLAARQLTIGDVRRVLGSQNADFSAGDFWESKRRWVVRTLGQFRNPEHVANQLLAVRDGAPIYVRDVAQVQFGFKKPDGLVRRFGEASISVNALRENGANVLDVMQGLKDATAELNESLLSRRGLVLTQVYDETEYINSAVDLVRQNIFVGGGFTMIVLMLFLHFGVRTMMFIPAILVTALAAAYSSPWYFALCLGVILAAGFWYARGALVVGLAIPISIVGTFLVLGILGRSLNVISLAGLAFAVGMLVDNAVVVLENIFRLHDLGEPPMRAAVRGAQQVWGAVVASTLTTIAVFLPIVFIQEEAGQLFRDIALAITASVAFSLVVSMTVIPTAAARLFTGSDQHKDQRGAMGSARFAGALSYFGAAFANSVVSMNRFVQQSAVRMVLVVAGLTATAVALTIWFWPQVEYLPTGNRNLVFGILLPPPGYNLDQLMEMGEQVEQELRPYWDVNPDSPEAEKLDFPVIADLFFVARGRQVFMGLRAVDASRVGELVPLVQQVSNRIPGTIAVVKQSSLFERGLTAGRTIDIEITGPDLEKLVDLGGQVLGQVKQLLPTAQARPVPSLDLSNPEVHIEPKLVQAADMGVSTSELGYAANALIDGAYAGDFFLGGDKIDLTIKGQDIFARSIQDIKALPIATPLGRVIPLAALADVEFSGGAEEIDHRERSRAITIEVSPPAEVALEDAIRTINTEIITPLKASGQVSGEYRINVAGTADKLRQTWLAIRFNVILALMITYLLMAALFESWLYPLVVIFSVPLGAVGGVLGLYVLNLFQLQTLDVLTMLGFVILIGTVVNNPILIVHQSLNHIREDGMTPEEGVLESVRTRIRPIFMTTLTTVLGLLPLVLFPGAGSELYRGLGSVVLGGLMVSTIFTLLLVPTLFTLSLHTKAAILKLLGRLRGQLEVFQPRKASVESM